MIDCNYFSDLVMPQIRVMELNKNVKGIITSNEQ